MRFVSYAQNFEDVRLWRAFQDVKNGFYVDIGAQDPVIDSVSLAFHERGWHGIHVEPSLHYSQMLRQARPGDVVIQAAVCDSYGVVPFFEVANAGLSTIDPLIAAQHREAGFEIAESHAPCITLDAVLDACKTEVIHWLKIDVEGAEHSVLKSWRASSRKPLVVVIESTLPLSQIESNRRWEELLIERGYSDVAFDGLNRYYVTVGRDDLASSLRAAPSLFDQFELSLTGSSSFHKSLDARLLAQQEAFAMRLAEAAQEFEQQRLEQQTRSAAEIATAHSAHAEAIAVSELERARADKLREQQTEARRQREAMLRDTEEIRASLEVEAGQSRQRLVEIDALRREHAQSALRWQALLEHQTATSDSLARIVERLASTRRGRSMLMSQRTEGGASVVDSAALRDLLGLEDDAFVRRAYELILGRAADPQGESAYVAQLGQGRSKLVIVSDMARSPEGLRRGVVVTGLRRALFTRRFRRLLGSRADERLQAGRPDA